MAELLINMISVDINNPAILCAGDVIVICEDNHNWSFIERTHEAWRIISIPMVNPSNYEHICWAEKTAYSISNPTHSVIPPGRSNHVRAFGLVFRDQTEEFSTFLNDATRAKEMFVITDEMFRNAIIAKSDSEDNIDIL